MKFTIVATKAPLYNKNITWRRKGLSFFDHFLFQALERETVLRLYKLYKRIVDISASAIWIFVSFVQIEVKKLP